MQEALTTDAQGQLDEGGGFDNINVAHADEGFCAAVQHATADFCRLYAKRLWISTGRDAVALQV